MCDQKKSLNINSFIKKKENFENKKLNLPTQNNEYTDPNNSVQFNLQSRKNNSQKEKEVVKMLNKINENENEKGIKNITNKSSQKLNKKFGKRKKKNTINRIRGKKLLKNFIRIKPNPCKNYCNSKRKKNNVKRTNIFNIICKQDKYKKKILDKQILKVKKSKENEKIVYTHEINRLKDKAEINAFNDKKNKKSDFYFSKNEKEEKRNIFKYKNSNKEEENIPNFPSKKKTVQHYEDENEEIANHHNISISSQGKIQNENSNNILNNINLNQEHLAHVENNFPNNNENLIIYTNNNSVDNIHPVIGNQNFPEQTNFETIQNAFLQFNDNINNFVNDNINLEVPENFNHLEEFPPENENGNEEDINQELFPDLGQNNYLDLF